MSKATDGMGEDQGREKIYKPFAHEVYDPFAEREVSISLRFCKPSAKATERCQKQMGKSPVMALKNLCAESVHPEDKAKMADLFGEYSGLPTTFGGALLKACGYADLGN
jgi:hypothetical protein